MHSALRPSVVPCAACDACAHTHVVPSAVSDPCCSCVCVWPLAHAPAGIEAKWAASSWGQKLAKREAKAAMTDFDRYKAMVTKTKKSRVVRKVFNQLKKASAKKK